jgi:hypothetical protein
MHAIARSQRSFFVPRSNIQILRPGHTYEADAFSDLQLCRASRETSLMHATPMPLNAHETRSETLYHNVRLFLPHILDTIISRVSLPLAFSTVFSTCRGILISAPARIEHANLAWATGRLTPARLQLNTRRDRLVASKALSHVNQPSLTLTIAVLELLALRRERFGEGQAEAIGGAIAVHHHAVRVL